MTRYSRWIWARDIRAISASTAAAQIHVSNGEKLWWKRLVYQRKTTAGRDMIVHLVRIPPTPNVDYEWADEPRALEGVRVTVDARLEDVAGNSFQGVLDRDLSAAVGGCLPSEPVLDVFLELRSD